MATAIYPQDYRQAAQERMTEASALRRDGSYAIAMYVAGLAAECTLRAYHRPDSVFDDRHDITKLFDRCDFDKLGDAGRRRLRGPIQTVHYLWLNRYRFFSERRLRAHLVSLDHHRRGVHKGADFLKIRCTELVDACLEIVAVGEARW